MLNESGLPTKRTEYRQQSGAPFAEIIEVIGNPSGPGERAPAILGLFPPETKAGAGFNVQPDGSAALAVESRNNNGSTVVLWADTPLASVSGDHVVTATVPRALFSVPGSIEVRLVNRDTGARSKPVPFWVR